MKTTHAIPDATHFSRQPAAQIGSFERRSNIGSRPPSMGNRLLAMRQPQSAESSDQNKPVLSSSQSLQHLDTLQWARYTTQQRYRQGSSASGGEQTCTRSTWPVDEIVLPDKETSLPARRYYRLIPVQRT